MYLGVLALILVVSTSSCRAERRPGRLAPVRPAPVSVVAPVAAMHARPDTGSSLVSELLYGERPALLEQAGQWERIRQTGGQIGWVRRENLGAGPGSGVAHVVAEPWLRVEPGESALRLPMGALVAASPAGGNAMRLLLPQGTATVPAAALRPAGTPAGSEVMIAAARRLLGAPYRWGGMTADGIDCSGLVHIAARVAGLSLPRDARQQYAAGQPVHGADLAPGDLVFFTSNERPGPSHVAIYLGNGLVIQSVMQRGVCLAPVAKPTPLLTWYGARRIWR